MTTLLSNATVRNKTDVREAAADYHECEWMPIPLRHAAKSPLPKEWQKLRRDAFDLEEFFPRGCRLNVGLSLGEPSGGLIDCDLDCPEARAAAAVLMPHTDMIWGRESAPDSHRGYVVTDPPDKASEPWNDPLRSGKGARLLELRSTGGQTVVPPSILPGDDDGKFEEPCVWRSQDKPAAVQVSELITTMSEVAVAALLGRYWPSGNRHDAALALSGGLLGLTHYA